MTNANLPSIHNCFNRLEDSSNYSAGVLQTDVAKNTSSIVGRGIKVKCHTYHGNHFFYVMATIISLLFLLFHPL